MTLFNQTISQYQVLSLFGEGGMGEVYRAHDTKLGLEVAINMLPEGFSKGANVCPSFNRSAGARVGSLCRAFRCTSVSL